VYDTYRYYANEDVAVSEESSSEDAKSE